MKGFLGVIALIGALYLVITQTEKPAPAPVVRTELTPEEKVRKAEVDKKKAEEDARWTREVVSLRVLRKSMKNPDSFKLEDAIRMASGALCVTYRATNSFNAIVPGRAVVLKDRIATSDDGDKFPVTWNRHCGGKSGEDVSYIRRAI